MPEAGNGSVPVLGNGDAEAHASLPIEPQDRPPEIELEEEVPAGDDSAGEAERLVRQYVEEIRREIAGGPPSPEPAVARRLMWLVGISSAVFAVGLSVLLWQQTAALTLLGQTAAAQERQLCAHRQNEVMQAIAEYVRDHGEGPPDLASLEPKYLHVPPVDPTSGNTFQYARQGSALWLACPKHPLSPYIEQSSRSVASVPRQGRPHK